MLEKLKELPNGIDGLRALGKVTKDDYEKVVEPMLDDARREGRHVRFLYQLGPEFEGFTPSAAWEDAKLGLRSMRLFEGCAVVSDIKWIREASRVIGFMMPCPVRIFANNERDKAVEWLSSLPQGAAVSHRLIPQSGVIVVDVRQALRAEDFDAMAATADSWIEAHGDLQGLVIHTREFPGWENLEGLLRHIQFVRDHHRKVRRIALAADSKLASVAPALAEQFAKAEVKRFAYESLDNAIAWAAGTPTQAATTAGAPVTPRTNNA